MIYIGIDPGASGGLAAMDKSGVISAVGIPPTEYEVLVWFRDLRRGWIDISTEGNGYGCMAMIEQVGAMPGQGVTSMFAFGRSYGFLRGLLVALEIPFEEVRPQKWQKEFGLIARGEKLTQTEKKNRNKQKAQQLWPHLKITHATADALLIAEYGRRMGQKGEA
jgi:crossover junction endodeoxyribonuclease RuvC